MHHPRCVQLCLARGVLFTHRQLKLTCQAELRRALGLLVLLLCPAAMVGRRRALGLLVLLLWPATMTALLAWLRLPSEGETRSGTAAAVGSF